MNFEDKAQRIKAANTAPASIVSVFVMSRADWKRRAASKLLYIRRNRATLKRWGKSHTACDARLLAEIAHCRKMAATTDNTPIPNLRAFPHGFAGPKVTICTTCCTGGHCTTTCF